MIKKMSQKKYSQTGQAFVLVIIVLAVVLVSSLLLVSGSQLYFQNTNYSLNSEKAASLAEAGVDKALNSLNKTGGSYNGEAETILGGGSYSVAVSNKDSATKLLTVTGFVPNKTSPQSKRTLTIQVSKGIGLSFNYGLQVGEGGLCMGNGSVLNGSIYSNGNISGGNSTSITGDVYVAGGTQPSADQQNDCSGVNCQDYLFGKSVNAENRQDVAQSFQPSQSKNLSKISLKIKKTGNPANPTVRIMGDTSGKPNKNNVLATGTLAANLVTSQYGFIDITFDQTPQLLANTTYWIAVHTNSLDSSNFWSWSNDLAQSYNGGVPKWSSNWQASNPIWTAISGDLGFKAYLGGVITSINLSNGSQINGNVHANTISGNMTIKKDAYYQTLGPSVVVKGSSFPGSTDPPPTVFPVSDANVTDWKNQAVAGGVSNGNVTGGNGCNLNLGPRKIVGNLNLGNSCTVTVKAPLWITGNINTGNSTKFILDPSFGGTSGTIIVDGTTTLGNGSDLKGSGTTGSFLMLYSTFDSTSQGGSNTCSSGSESGQAAVDTGNSSISGILYTPKGIVNLANGASFKEITAWQITLGNSATLTYDTGFASTVFSAGPAGSFSIVKGTYQIK